MDINRVVLVGRITQKPEVRTTSGGISVCQFSIALNRRRRNQQDEYKDEVSFINCVAWRRTAEVLGQYADKGKQVGIDGRLQQNRWQDRDGNNRSRVEVVVENLQLLGSGQGGGGQNYRNESGGSMPPGSMPPEGGDYASGGMGGEPFPDSGGYPDAGDNPDDIPF